MLLVDDHAVVRAGLKTLLKAAERMQIVGEASSGEEAVEMAETLEPDIVVMDRAMPGIDGIEATRQITELELGAKILVLAVHDEDEFLVPALKAGATGFDADVTPRRPAPGGFPLWLEGFASIE